MYFSNVRFDYWLTKPLWRFVVNSLVVFAMGAVYMVIDHHQPAPPTTVLMPSWVPFCPAFVLPYAGMLLMMWLLPVSIRDAGRFRACLRAYVIAWLLVVPWWILTPTMLPRPPLPDSPWADCFRIVWALDQPYNVMPCVHGIVPLVAAWFAGRDHPAWRWPLAGILVLGLASIALIWQHRPIDILLGTAAALIGIVVSEALSRREQSNLNGLDEIAGSFCEGSDVKSEMLRERGRQVKGFLFF